jgi:hypothetical protein
MSKISVTIDKESLVIIEDLDAKKLLGTGSVFIRKDWVLTAKHVVMHEGIARNNICAIFNAKKISAKVIYAHKEVDLAVLELSESICLRPLTTGHASLTGSKGLISVGYSPKITQSSGNPSINIEAIENFDYEKRERSFGTEELIVFEAPTSEGGHSGGPILGDGASIVGIIIQNFSQNGKTYARATSISPLLDELSLPKLVDTTSSN